MTSITFSDTYSHAYKCFVILTSNLKLFDEFDLEPKNTNSAKFKHNQAIILKCIQVSSFPIPKDDMTHWKQKVAIETSYNNNHCQRIQNESQRCKVKVAKCYFIILWHFWS